MNKNSKPRKKIRYSVLLTKGADGSILSPFIIFILFLEGSLANTTKQNTIFHFIPSGLKRILQPLDVSINASFKKDSKNKYILYCINNEENIKITKEKMFNWIVEIYIMKKLSQSIRFIKVSNVLVFLIPSKEMKIKYLLPW